MNIKANKNAYPFRKLNQELIDKIVSDIKRGSPKKHAAEANGISDRMLHLWVAQGLVDMEHDKDESLCANLVRSLRKVEQDEIILCRERIRNNEKSHAGAQWTLEHAYWQFFSANAPAMYVDEQLQRLILESQERQDASVHTGALALQEKLTELKEKEKQNASKQKRK